MDLLANELIQLTFEFLTTMEMWYASNVCWQWKMQVFDMMSSHLSAYDKQLFLSIFGTVKQTPHLVTKETSNEIQSVVLHRSKMTALSSSQIGKWIFSMRLQEVTRYVTQNTTKEQLFKILKPYSLCGCWCRDYTTPKTFMQIYFYCSTDRCKCGKLSVDAYA